MSVWGCGGADPVGNPEESSREVGGPPGHSIGPLPECLESLIALEKDRDKNPSSTALPWEVFP